MREQLKQLIAKWRTEATESLEKWPRGAILPSKKLRQCADDLETALAAWQRGGDAEPKPSDLVATRTWWACLRGRDELPVLYASAGSAAEDCDTDKYVVQVLVSPVVDVREPTQEQP